jgi:hypothetical protein
MGHIFSSRLGVYFAAVALLAAGVSAKLSAQVLYGSVTGTISDETGAVVPGAKIVVVNDETGLRREAETDATGIYRILDLPAGTLWKHPRRDSDYSGRQTSAWSSGR